MEPIFIKRNELGRGVYAARSFKKGEKIMVLKGEKISANELSNVAKKGRNALIDPLQIDDHTFINLDEPSVLLNHSCDPNAGVLEQKILVALRSIKKGEEIRFDYSTVWLEGFKCRCGSPKCREMVGDFLTLPESSQRRYLQQNVVPYFIVKK